MEVEDNKQYFCLLFNHRDDIEVNVLTELHLLTLLIGVV